MKPNKRPPVPGDDKADQVFTISPTRYKVPEHRRSCMSLPLLR